MSWFRFDRNEYWVSIIFKHWSIGWNRRGTIVISATENNPSKFDKEYTIVLFPGMAYFNHTRKHSSFFGKAEYDWDRCLTGFGLGPLIHFQWHTPEHSIFFKGTYEEQKKYYDNRLAK